MANGNFGGGDGSEQNPFLVEDAEDLVALQDSKLPPLQDPADPSQTFHISIVSDIDMEGYEWNEWLYHAIHFEGNGHTISYLTLNADFFGSFIFSFKNITFDNLSVGNEYACIINTGALSSFGFIGEIDNVTVNCVGDIPFYPFGYLSSFIINNVTVNISHSSNGSLASAFNYLDKCELDNVNIDIHNISDEADNIVYGIAMLIRDSSLHNCSASILSNGVCWGLAFQISDSNLKHCRTTIENLPNSFYSRPQDVGGIARYIEKSSLSFCSAQVFGKFNGAGFAYDIDNSVVEDSYTIVNEVVGAGAGFAREASGNSSILRSYSNGSLVRDIDKNMGIPVATGFISFPSSQTNVENCIAIINSITAFGNDPSNDYYRFSSVKEKADTNYVLAEMQFIDERDFSSWGGSSDPIPFDDGIPIPDETLKTQAFYESLGFEFGRGKWIIDEGSSYPRHDYGEPIPVHQCKTFYLN